MNSRRGVESMINDKDQDTWPGTGRSRTKRGLWISVVVVVVVGAVLGVVLRGSDSGGHAASLADPKAQPASSVQSSTTIGGAPAVTLPAGWTRPVALAADPTTSGVWFLTANTSEDAIDFWNAGTANLSTYPLPTKVPLGDQAAVAVAPTGTVWAGVHTSLFRLDPGTGNVSEMAIASIPTSDTPPGGPGGGPGGPPRLFSTHAVTSVVVEPNGDLAISMSFTEAVVVYDPTTQQFTIVALPEGDLAGPLADLPDGNLAVTVGSGHPAVVVTPANAVAQETISTVADLACNKTLCVSGEGHSLEMVKPGGSTGSPSTGSASVTEDRVNVTSVVIRAGSSATPLTDGQVLVSTTSGFATVTPQSGSTNTFTVPKAQCTVHPPLGTGAAAGQATTDAGGECGKSPTDYIVDPSGNVWFTTNLTSGQVFEMASNQY